MLKHVLGSIPINHKQHINTNHMLFVWKKTVMLNWFNLMYNHPNYYSLTFNQTSVHLIRNAINCHKLLQIPSKTTCWKACLRMRIVNPDICPCESDDNGSPTKTPPRKRSSTASLEPWRWLRIRMRSSLFVILVIYNMFSIVYVIPLHVQ